MADRIPPEKRSWNMSQIKGKDTKIEIRVRKYLFSKGFRYRKNVSGLPGRPDIVLPKYKTVIFIHGCFWHRHPGCRYAVLPSTRVEFWRGKFEKTVLRDQMKEKQLESLGWHVIVLWECDINHNFISIMEDLMANIKNIKPNYASTLKY